MNLMVVYCENVSGFRKHPYLKKHYQAACKQSPPFTCVRVSILDLGHSLRGGSNMGRGRAAKAALCVAIIHLFNGKKTEIKTSR